MKFQKVKCLLRMNQGGNVNLAAVSFAGPSALFAPEIPILRARHEVGEEGMAAPCFTLVEKVGEVDETASNMLNMLRRKYGAGIVNAIYPGGRGLPKTIADCELPEGSLATSKKG